MDRVALFFPGQGAFYGGVLQDTRLYYPKVKQLLDRVEAVALRRFGRSLLATIWQPNSSAEYLLKTDAAMLQLAIFTVSLSAFEMLKAEQLTPHVLVGHSLGEIAALTCAGVYTLEQGANIVCDRVEVLAQAAPPEGCMASISAAPAQVQQLLNTFNETRAAAPNERRSAEPNDTQAAVPATELLTIAVENHDSQTVVSGAKNAITEFMTLCGEHNISAQLLNSPYGFHHPTLARAEALFASRLAAYPTAPLLYPVYSPILGRFYTDHDVFALLIAQHLVLPVRFSQAVRYLRQDASVCIECGALNTLSKIIIRIVGPGVLKVFPTLDQHDAELTSIRTIIHHFEQAKIMNIPKTNDTQFADFEAYWQERGPILMAHIKNELLSFFSAEQAQRNQVSQAHVATLASVVHMVSPSKTAPATTTIARPQLFNELVNIYAEAMEYPAEVFSEEVQLEAELGIDSVKQTEIIGRIRTQYHLPPLPANFRSGDFRTMGQIVDFVFSQQGQAVVPA